MVLILLVIVLGSGLLMWLWKGPVQNIVAAMQRNGSSTAEAYGIIIFISSVLGVIIYLIATII
jgi:hypothetical protein